MWAGRPPNEESLIIMRGRLGCVTYYARDYARDYARPPTGDWGCILKKSNNIYCTNNGLSIAWMLTHCKHNDIHRKRKHDGMCIA